MGLSGPLIVFFLICINYLVSRIIIMNQQVDSKLLVLSILGMGKWGVSFFMAQLV